MNYVLIGIASCAGGFCGVRLADWCGRRRDNRTMRELQDEMIEEALQHMLREEHRRRDP